MKRTRDILRSLPALSGLILLLLQGCAAPIPLHEGSPPRTLGKGVVRTAFILSHTPGVEASRDTLHGHMSTGGTLKGAELAVGVDERVDLEMGVHLGGESHSWRLGIKYRWLGTPTVLDRSMGDLSGSIALRCGIIADGGFGFDLRDVFGAFGPNPRIMKFERIGGRFWNLSLPVGLYPTPFLGLYAGVAAVGGVVEGSPSRSDRTVRFRKRVNGLGCFSGICLRPKLGDRVLELTAEAGLWKLPDLPGDEKVAQLSAHLVLSLAFEEWGSRRR